MNEAAWRQIIVQGVLCLLLPPEDLSNPCLRVLVSEIFSELVIGKGACGSACEGWLLWDGVTKVIRIFRPMSKTLLEASAGPITPNRLEQFGLLSPNKEPRDDAVATGPCAKDNALQWLLPWLGYLVILFNAIRAIVVALASSSSLPQRGVQAQGMQSTHLQANGTEEVIHVPENSGSLRMVNKRPLIEMSIWTCFSTLTSLSARMPWMTGAAAMLQHFLVGGLGRVGDTDGRLDR